MPYSTTPNLSRPSFCVTLSFSSLVQIPWVGREPEIFICWEQFWDLPLLCRQSRYYLRAAGFSPTIYGVVTVILSIPSASLEWGIEESQLWAFTYQSEKWWANRFLSLGFWRVWGNGGKAGWERNNYQYNQSHCSITWQDSHQALQGLFFSSHFLLLGPHRPWTLR